jgi:DNA-binding FadR family transcriptional regulator
MNFKKAKQNRIFQDIVDQIEGAILDDRIKPDQRLPAERDLCEQFKASRGTLREALRILEQKGLNDGKPGHAYPIRQSNADPSFGISGRG